MNAFSEPIPFAGSTLGDYRHVCAFFSSREEEYATMMPFIRDGIERGERALHIVRSRYLEDHLDRLRRAGIDVAAAQGSGQLEVGSDEKYIPKGRFDKKGAILDVEGALKKGKALGFPLTRLFAHAQTVLEDWSNLDDWVEYEAMVNDLSPRYPDPLICTYDSNLLNGTLVVDILRTHPVALIGGRLYENPFFAPPHEFLEQIRQRSAGLGQYGRMTPLTS